MIIPDRPIARCSQSRTCYTQLYIFVIPCFIWIVRKSCAITWSWSVPICFKDSVPICGYLQTHWQQLLLRLFHTNSSRTPFNIVIVLVIRKVDQVQCSSGHPPTIHQRRGRPQLELEISVLRHVIQHTQHSRQVRSLSRSIMTLMTRRSNRRLKFRRWNGRDKPLSYR